MSLTEEKVSFHSGPLTLEGNLTYPEDRTPKAGAAVLSPHPHFAGNLDNNVVRAVAAGLGAAGMAVLRFNYRGVDGSGLEPGLSAYDYWERVEREKLYEPIVEDAEAAFGFLHRNLGGGGALHAVGYSFGAVVAGLAAVRSNVHLESAVLIAPPLRRYSFAFLAGSAVPYGLVLADEDFLYGDDEVAAQAAAAPPRRVDSLAADHFFRGSEDEVARRVLAFLENPS